MKRGTCPTGVLAGKAMYTQETGVIQDNELGREVDHFRTLLVIEITLRMILLESRKPVGMRMFLKPTFQLETRMFIVSSFLTHHSQSVSSDKRAGFAYRRMKGMEGSATAPRPGCNLSSLLVRIPKPDPKQNTAINACTHDTANDESIPKRPPTNPGQN